MSKFEKVLLFILLGFCAGTVHSIHADVKATKSWVMSVDMCEK